MTAMRSFGLLIVFALAASPQTKTTWEDMPGYTLSNGTLDVTLLTTGGTVASVVLTADKDKLNPLWDPIRFAKESGHPLRRAGAGVGQFLCVDGFGPVSKEEEAAGMQGHGEAHRQSFETKLARNENGVQTVTLETDLPMLQEHLTRTYELRQGENIVYVRSKLQSLLSFDRPLVWAEHATIGSPFLEAGVTVVDMPAKRAQTRPYTASEQHRLAVGQRLRLADGASGRREAGRCPRRADQSRNRRPYDFTDGSGPEIRLCHGDSSNQSA